MSSKVKVIGQRSRSPGWKNVISEVSAGWITQSQFVISPDVMWHHDMTSWHQGTTSWRHVTSLYSFTKSRHDVLTSFDDFWARILTKRARRGRARQRSGVFIWLVKTICSNYNSHVWFEIVFCNEKTGPVCVMTWAYCFLSGSCWLNCCHKTLVIVISNIELPCNRITIHFSMTARGHWCPH